ncbi:hypothetical protein HCN51_42140 [Nonomuraea sp. FMUSA5-5]|uniref:Uncharacterized protein n=1 Tax=Nonomuraea composti TaxID=2720023 RepID=A0ABX1BE73_9ACTN|nr:hypothetical protein [Nonomuraea sp. FMUSA5-5]NJP95966.1 hypothetical protein [Nonomuraea sp. FMUSA5-5]
MVYFPALQQAAAWNSFKEAARWEKRLVPTVVMLSTAVANVPGMGDAKANWNALAKALEVEYPGLLGNAVFLSRADWIADDRQAFLNAAAVFGGDLQKLSGLCYTMEGQVDQIRDAYARYWYEIGALASIVLSYLAATLLMRATPYLRAQGEIALARLVAFTNFVLANQTKILATFLAAVAVTMADTGTALPKIFNLTPTGGARIDFQRAVISMDPPSQWVAPKREKPEHAKNTGSAASA